MKSKKTGHAAKLDQFYTSAETSNLCIEVAKRHFKGKFFIEPAAGNGSFSKLLSKHLSIDIDPKDSSILKRNFLTSSPEDFKELNKLSRKDICIVGNPPFGKNASMAVKFFNHSTKFADTIAFIVPKTFRKKSLQNKLDLNYWLVDDVEIPKNSFTYEGSIYNVPCCFQVWQRKPISRGIYKPLESSYVEFVEKDIADFAVRRVGGRTGKAYIDVDSRAEVSHYFLKIKQDQVSLEEMVKIINDLDFSKEANSTAGVRSISKGEFVEKLEEALNNSFNPG